MAFEHRGIDRENNDPSISYIGEWTTVPANIFNHVGDFGPPLSTTLHSTKTTSGFVFPFQGSSIFVYGTVNITDSGNPTWKCSVDGSTNGIGLGIPNSVPFVSNRWSLCNMTSIPDGSHELVVNITSDGTPFYLDYIGYLPSADVSLENTLIVIDNLDPMVNYVSGWEALGSAANQTTDPNSLFNLAFVGIQISWYGFLLPEATTGGPRNVSSGEYSVDGTSFSPFQILNTSGTATITPLTLDYLIVANGSFSSSLSPSSPDGGANRTGTSHSLSDASATNYSLSNAGSIAGEVLGAIVGMQRDRHSTPITLVHKTSQIAENPITPLPSNVNSNDITLPEPFGSDSDSVGTHLFHTRILIPFNNSPLLASTHGPSAPGSTNDTDGDGTRLSSSIALREADPPPSYTIN
ncbi:hypothetical protein Clacol_010220 [Clathrus columnatus]|uniref:Uncharacterized protein n=1 Tax=Clathrus columnatus TaxID=1419009 RepID=A0AAV5AT57_9AGAM|nr:hypothetical protein Clacol_010220 [Clathrus columnatus]